MDTQQHSATPHLIRLCKSGIDLESAYKVLIKAYLRRQIEQREVRKQEDTNALHTTEVQATEHEDTEYSSH